MRLKVLLLVAFAFPMGKSSGEVVTLSNSGTTGVTNTGTLRIKLTTLGSGAFNLSSLTLAGSNQSDTGVSWALLNSSAQTINSITGSDVTVASGVLTFNNANTFGSGTYWLQIAGLDSGIYTRGASSTLTSSNTGQIETMAPGLVDGIPGNASAEGELFQASLAVTVPEPATMILTSSALAAGAIGTYFKRRRKTLAEKAT